MEFVDGDSINGIGNLKLENSSFVEVPSSKFPVQTEFEVFDVEDTSITLIKSIYSNCYFLQVSEEALVTSFFEITSHKIPKRSENDSDQLFEVKQLFGEESIEALAAARFFARNFNLQKNHLILAIGFKDPVQKLTTKFVRALDVKIAEFLHRSK